MASLNPLLLELFESACRDLAQALETSHRQSNGCDPGALAMAAERLQRIATLEIAIAALDRAFDQRENGIVH